MALFFEDELHPYIKEERYNLASLLAGLKLSHKKQ
jgi:hypothetical protein